MKAVAPHDRPREKLQRLGAAALGDNELLAIVLGHGRPRASALDMANAVLEAADGAHGLVRTRYDDLCAIPGIGARAGGADSRRRRAGTADVDAAAARARADRRMPRSAAEFLLPQYGSRPVEQFGVVLLDTKHRVIRTLVLSVGTLDASIVHPREVFGAAAAAGAAALVLFHNHPSGDPRPSPDDVELTRRLAAAGVLMGIDVIDHVILADVRYYSFKEEGRF